MLQVVEALDLDGLIVIGGDDSNTNAAILAEFFEANGCKTKVGRGSLHRRRYRPGSVIR